MLRLVFELNVLNLVQYVSALGAYGVVYDFAAGVQGDGKPGCSVFAKDKLRKLIEQELVLTEMEPFLLFLQKFCIACRDGGIFTADGIAVQNIGENAFKKPETDCHYCGNYRRVADFL